MSLAQKVSALRGFFGSPDDAPLLPAIEAMNLAMGIVATGPLATGRAPAPPARVAADRRTQRREGLRK